MELQHATIQRGGGPIYPLSLNPPPNRSADIASAQAPPIYKHHPKTPFSTTHPSTPPPLHPLRPWTLSRVRIWN